MNNVKRANNARIAYIISGAVSAIAGVASLVLVNHFMDARSYVMLAIFFAISAIGFYATVFLLFAAFDRAIAARLIPVAEELGTDNVAAIAEVFGWRENTAAKYIAKCKKWRYL
jgi:hypothetical protein